MNKLDQIEHRLANRDLADVGVCSIDVGYLRELSAVARAAQAIDLREADVPAFTFAGGSSFSGAPLPIVIPSLLRTRIQELHEALAPLLAEPVSPPDNE